jgi:uncharacterized protein (UPF0332 family)/predicted nucleotidyltransferase|tara:strand:+ start:274 stop:1080 length:807 start_codon:yes stop_codon:yes gene_type:complete
MVKFKIERRDHPQVKRYSSEEIKIARKLADRILEEFGSFVKSIVLFGSAARAQGKSKPGDVDVLVIVNDLNMVLSGEAVETYRVIMERLVRDTSDRLHVTTLKLSNFWDYVRLGDPLAINILRDGVALIDTGIFDPMQALLYMGRIRPTYEAIFTYYSRAPATLANSKWHVLQATLDLYWAVIDAAHAALMKHGEIPPSPAHVADMMEKTLVKDNLIEKRYVTTMKDFYVLAKKIMHRELKEVTGKQFDQYYKLSEDFVKRIKKIIEP